MSQNLPCEIPLDPKNKLLVTDWVQDAINFRVYHTMDSGEEALASGFIMQKQSAVFLAMELIRRTGAQVEAHKVLSMELKSGRPKVERRPKPRQDGSLMGALGIKPTGSGP